MAAWGADVTMLTAGTGRSIKSPTTEGVRIVTVPALRMAGMLRAEVSISPQMFRRAFREAAEHSVEVLHANSLHFQSSLAAAALQRARSIPLVTTVHLASVGELPPTLRTATRAYERVASRFILRRSVNAIAVSASVAAHVLSLGMPEDRIVTIPNGVDHDVFKPGAVAPRAVPHLAMIGRLIGNKGPDIFIDALGRLRDSGVDFTASLVGDGPMRSALAGKVADLSLSDRVTLTGHVTDVAAELRRADVVVRPSLTEGMPLSVLEAMASGVCVVASAVPGTTDLVTDGVNGVLVPPRSEEALAAALRRVIAAPEERQQLAAAGHATSLAHSWDRSAAAAAGVLVDAARRAPLSAS